MIEPADPAKFANAARNRTFILGFLCGAVVAGLLAFVVQLAPARTDTPAPGQTGPASTGNTPIPQPTNPGSPPAPDSTWRGASRTTRWRWAARTHQSS